SVHADWSIGNDASFREVLLLAEAAAIRTHTLVPVGVVPTRPDTGFGDIEAADRDEKDGSPVLRFVEKPDRQRAEKMVADGYLWNSGIFVWTVGDFLTQGKRHARELARAMALGPDADASDFFGRVANPISVDVAVLERSKDVTVVPGDFGWDDVGTWS